MGVELFYAEGDLARAFDGFWIEVFHVGVGAVALDTLAVEKANAGNKVFNL